MRTTYACLLVLAGCSTPQDLTCAPACAAGFRCESGACIPDGTVGDGGGADQGGGACQPACGGVTPYCNGAGHCVGCTMDSQCPTGKYCKVQDDAHATCLVGCDSDDRCGNGKCCNMQCVDTNSDPANCGGCGKACSGAHASATCNAGQCAPGACDPGWRDCDGDPGNGCETNLHVDPNNCTACGMGCSIPHALAACADGCYISACNFGFDDCNQDPMDGCETSVLADASNCGACGKPCNALPNATASCAAGNCVLGVCNKGYADCDGNPMNGCEAQVAFDAKNCGGCGVVCQNGLFCVNGACAMTMCGDKIKEPGEEWDPPPGPFMSAPVDGGTCRFHFENVVQLYCNGGCSWAGANDCDQADADIFCKLKTGNPNSTAAGFKVTTALAQPGFCCPQGNFGMNLGPLPTRGVNVNVYYQDSSILANHGAGNVISTITCN